MYYYFLPNYYNYFRNNLIFIYSCGPKRDRTDDLLNANQALSQLSYGPLSTLPE